MRRPMGEAVKTIPIPVKMILVTSLVPFMIKVKGLIGNLFSSASK